MKLSDTTRGKGGIGRGWRTWRQGQSKQVQNEDAERREPDRGSVGARSSDALAGSSTLYDTCIFSGQG